jgi:hypothetical protein
MLPKDLTPRHFTNWPPRAREIAVDHIGVLRQLPLCFITLLFRELIDYDWKFPAERDELDRQFTYLASAPASRTQPLLSRFAQLQASGELERLDWVNAPAQFSERLSAHLWASHQIDAFRSAAVDYVEDFNSAVPQQLPRLPRAGIVVIGRGVGANSYRLFRKFRPHGTYFPRVQSRDGFRTLLDSVSARVAAHPHPYSHWYIEGGAVEDRVLDGLTVVSYSALEPVRAALADRMRSGYQSRSGPEALRNALTAVRPDQVRLNGGDAAWNRFALSLFTEGSGTQIFSTTFVQWAAREALRRAQPLTLIAHFAPRVREQSMDQLLSPGRQRLELDPEGSLIDADMGAWYTWLNLQRLKQSEAPSFLVWFEEHEEAVAVGPAFPRGAESAGRRELAELFARVL